VQVALLTQRINELTEHFKVHKKIMADERFRKGDFSTKFMEEFQL
jgi:ribosomal protein S15P/S13E